MITKEFTYKKAFENQKNALKEKQIKYDMMLASAYASIPRLKELDVELSGIGANLAISALSGDLAKLEALKAKSIILNKERNQLLNKADVKPIRYDCDICNDTGYVSGKICNCIKKNAAKIMISELSKQMPLFSCTFENFDLKYYKDNGKEAENPKKRMTSILMKCREYAENFNPETSKNLLFLGNTGLGKTHLTLAIVSKVIEKGYLPVYSSAENLFSMIEKEKFAGEGIGSYDSILNCDLLVIDDLGAEMATNFTKSVLYNIVNTRILSSKPTIINTNLSIKEIENIYTARIASRFIGNYEAYKFLGDDIRQIKVLGE